MGLPARSTGLESPVHDHDRGRCLIEPPQQRNPLTIRLTPPVDLLESRLMFGFGRGKQPTQEQVYQQVLDDLEAGKGSIVEAGIVSAKSQGNQGFAFFIQAVTCDQLLLPTSIPGDRSGANLLSSNGLEFIALFSRPGRAEKFRATAPHCEELMPVYFMELLFSVNAEVGMVINPGDEFLDFTLEPELLGNIREALRKSYNLPVGGYFWLGGEEPRVVKLLARDDVGVHIATYTNRVETKPDSVDPATLTFAETEGSSITGIGHMPFSLDTFLSHNPLLIQEGEVADDELDGYRSWKEAGGGYF